MKTYIVFTYSPPSNSLYSPINRLCVFNNFRRSDFCLLLAQVITALAYFPREYKHKRSEQDDA